MNDVRVAEDLARKAHAGQFRKDGVTPYISHPAAVAKSCVSKELECIAWLHDVLEDTNVTVERLRELFDEEIVEAVICLTKKKDEAYLFYLLRVKENPSAKIVKMKDIQHNLSTLPEKNKTMRDKYELALWVLNKV
jgi:(p)ppGpp synthase/HD superfamily hydrolase